MDQWKDIKTIFSLARFVVAKRAGFDTSHLPKEVMFLDFEPLPVSSTEIRKSIKSGHFSESSVPEKALTYILNHQLYR